MKKTVIIIITLAMALTVFATACGNAGTPPADSREPRPLENDIEVARGSSSTGGLDTKYSGITLDDLNQLNESDEANFKVQAINMDGWASTTDQNPINTYSGLSK